jgi:hypothetical protein
MVKILISADFGNFKETSNKIVISLRRKVFGAHIVEQYNID